MVEDIFRIRQDKDRARSLFEMAGERAGMIKILPKDKSYRIIEEYYEIIKELLTALMYADGYKTLSHTKLIEYFSKNYTELDSFQINLINILRKFRNEIVYYGKKISENFLVNYKDKIEGIIKILIKVVEHKTI